MKRINLEGYIHDIIQRKITTYHVEVRQHGEVVGKFDWRDNRRDNIHSVSKSFVSMAVGIAVHEGVLRLDEKPAEIWPEKLPRNPAPNLLKMTVRDAIMMACGHDYFILEGYSGKPGVPGRDELENDDWIQYAMTFDVPYTPGTYWKYNNFGPYLCSVLIQDRTGQRLRDYLMPRLFQPLGIRNPQWFEAAAGGYTLGCGGLHLSTAELSRFGQLLVNKGEWEGQQLIPAAWVEEATAFQISNDVGDPVGPDKKAGYGYFFWRCARDNAYRGYGWGGQYVIVLPEQDACVAIMSHDFDDQGIMDCVWDNIVPQLKENA